MMVSELPAVAAPLPKVRKPEEGRPIVREEKIKRVPEADKAQAKEVAQRLAETVGDRNVKFIVRDPNSMGINNVIIEIRNGDKVVATIPSKEVARLAQMQKEALTSEDMKGIVVDSRVG